MKLLICAKCGNIDDFSQVYSEVKVYVRLYGDIYDIDDVSYSQNYILVCNKCGSKNVLEYEVTIKGISGSERVSLAYLQTLSAEARFVVVEKWEKEGKLKRVSKPSSAMPKRKLGFWR